MIRPAVSRRAIIFALAWLALIAGCARLPPTAQTPLKPRSFSDLQVYLRGHTANLDQFRLRGPFAVKLQEDFEIRLSTTELIKTDLFLSAHAEKAPLVIILHGYESTKESHTYQAQHLASWGMHSLTVQLPNKGPWIANGKTLAKITNFVRRWPEIVDGRIDVSKIILVGHSFGGASVAVALADGAPAAGGILLDPAFIGRDLPNYLRQVNKPVMLLGADDQLSRTRNREFALRYIRSGISEISIKDATHDDAQYPSGIGLATEEHQITFVSAMTATAFSLAFAGDFDYAWASFGDALGSGKLFDAERK